MYKKFISASIALLMGVSASAWKIEGHISGVADSDSVIVRIIRLRHNIGRSFAADTIRSGRFVFTGTLPAGEQAKMMVTSSSGRYTTSLWMTDTTQLRIEGSADGAWKAVSNEPEQAIEGKIRAVDLSDLDALLESRESYFKYRDSVWRVSVDRLWPVYSKYPTSRAMLNSLHFYVRVGAVPREKMQWIYDRLTSEMRSTLEGEALAVALDPPHVPQVGEPFADFTAADTAGTVHKLSDYAGRGEKYVLLDLWSSGCGGCYAAFPEMKRLYAEYGDRLEIIGIGLDVNRNIWKETIRWQQLPWKQLSDGKGDYAGAGVLYNRTGVMPTYVLIDPQGRIVEWWYPGEGGFQDKLVDPYLEKR
ncbi:TlpA disulfide reductase family protein [uncultured Rikenella sp.]|uniref:TlpA family protein disulfide reductase n=1 Tax=uncultured Rikenella sp. TaxID=368003 RepID=UPI00260242D7|nr:TlpA disulfide reductase family protein [uncultured Rikenella sp.]